MITDANLLGLYRQCSGISLLPFDQHHLGLSTYDRALVGSPKLATSVRWGT